MAASCGSVHSRRSAHEAVVSRHPPNGDRYAGPVPVADKGQEIARFDLPEGERGRPAREIDVVRLCTTMKVDTRHRVLIARDVAAD